MGATLQETLAEMEAEAAAKQAAPPVPRVAPPKPTVAPPPPAPEKKPSLLDKAKDLAGKAAKFQAEMATPQGKAKLGTTLGAAVLRAPGQLMGGMIDTMGDVQLSMGHRIDDRYVRAATSLALNAVAPGQGTVLADTSYLVRKSGASLADTLSLRKTLGSVGYQGINQFTTEGIAMAAPMVATGGLGILPRIAGAAAGGAIAMDARNTKDRVVNAAVGAAFEAGGEVVANGVKYVIQARKLARATPDEAAQDALDRAFAARRTEDALTAQAEAQAKGEPVEPLPQEHLPNGTRAADADAGSGKGPSLAEDTNAALEMAGAAERIDPASGPKLSPSGKVLVSPEAKAAVDEAGLGRAFAEDTGIETPTTLFKEVDDAGGQRVVGSMPTADLEALAAEVARLKADPASINIKDGQPHGQWSMAQLGADYDAPAMLRAIVDQLPKAPNQAPRLTQEQMAEQAALAADALGQTPEDAMAFIRDLAGQHGDIPTANYAAQTMWRRMGQDVHDLIGTDWSTATDDMVLAAMAKIHNLHMFSTAMEEVKYGAGRGLNALMGDADTYLARARRNLKNPNEVPPTSADNPPPLPRTREELDQWLQMWDALKDNPKGQADFLKGIRQYPSGSMYLRTAFVNFFTANILSGVKTIMMNFVGPATMSTLQTFERTSAASFMGFNPFISAGERETFRAIAAATPQAYFGALADIGDAFKLAVQSARQGGRSVLGGENPVDLVSGPLHVPAPMIRAAQADGKTGIPYYLGNLINYWPRAVWNMHGTTNELATHLAYMGEVRASAMIEAADLGLKGPAARAHIADRLTGSIDNASGEATDAAALDRANRATMVRRTDPEYNAGAARLIQDVNRARMSLPELRLVIPVLQQPANAIGETLRRIPGVNFLLRETRAELSGSLGPARQADAYGRMMLGGGFIMAGGIMARNSLLTGAGPQNPQDRRVWLETHQPYSIRLGDEWVSYDRLDPIGPLLALVGDHYDHTVYHGADQESSLAVIGALAQYFKDKGAAQGIADVLNFGGDPREVATMKGRLGSMAKGFLVPSFMQTGRIAADQDLRVKRSAWDYVKDALPGLSKELDPVRNILGENVHKPADTIGETMVPLTLSPVNTYAKDPVLDEVDRMYNVTGYTPGALSPSFGGQAKFDMRDAKLEDGHSLYDHLMRARLTTTVDGKTLRVALNDLFNSQEYADAPDGTGKVTDEDFATMNSRGGLMQQTFSAYGKQAKLDVAQASPMAATWMAAAKIKTTHNDQLRGEPLDKLVRDPSFFQSLGIDLAAYEAQAKGE